MPLPFILAGAALVAAGVGVKKGIDAYCDKEETEWIHTKAKNEYQDGVSRLEKQISSTNKAFEVYGDKKHQVFNTSLQRYKKLIDELNISNDIDSEFNQNIRREIAQFNKSYEITTTAITSLIGGTIAGGMAGFGAYGGAMTLACASTGTAISSLSGVAATNATLAWFGGGSLAVGGLGMAGGTAILGGIVAGPVILVAGSIFAKMAEKNKYDAQSYYKKVQSLVNVMDLKGTTLRHVTTRIEEKIETLQHYNISLHNLIDDVENIMINQGKNTRIWGNNEQKKLTMMVDMANSIVGLINNPALNENDPLSQELLSLEKKYNSINSEIQERWGKN